MTIKVIGYSVMSSNHQILDQRIFLYDSELISEELAAEMIKDPTKRAIYPNSYFDVTVSRLPFILSSFGALKEIYSSITKEGEEPEEEPSFIDSHPSKYLS